MVSKEKYMMFCLLILTSMLLNLEDENHYLKTKKCSPHSSWNYFDSRGEFQKVTKFEDMKGWKVRIFFKNST